MSALWAIKSLFEACLSCFAATRVSKITPTEVSALFPYEKSLDDLSAAENQLLNYHPAIYAEYLAARDGLMRQWWRALKLSDDYAPALLGIRGQPWDSVAKEFGQLGEDFAEWWLERGMHVFARSEYLPSVRKLEPDEFALDDPLRPTLYLAIPLDLGRQVISRQINLLIDKERAAYGITKDPAGSRDFYQNQRLHLPTITKMLDVYETRKTNLQYTGRERRLEWWEIGQAHDVSEAARPEHSDDADTVKHKRRLMTLATQRLYRMATALIDFAARGDFPRIK